MNSYTLLIRTKLGSEKTRKISASDEETAIRLMKAKFPLAETMTVTEVVEGSGEQETPTLSVAAGSDTSAYFDSEREMMKLCQEGKNHMIIGALLFVVGLTTLVVLWIGEVGMSPLFLLFYLLPAFGLLDFSRGYGLWKQNRPEARAREQLRS